ncbi:MAG: PEP-CTERM sorting domain-containing protein [Roseateles sp.]
MFGDSPLVSRNPVDLSFSHISHLQSESTGIAYAGPEHGGTVRAIATTGDETIGAQAGLNYIFQLQPKPGALLPDVVTLHVSVSGNTGSENYATAAIVFTLDWADSPTTAQSIIKRTGVGSDPGGIETWGGDGSIHVDQDISVALNRDILVQMFAAASAGISVIDQNLKQDEYGTGSAYVDPVFTLPAELRNLVNIVGVPAAPIPEPATWLMTLAGLGVIGALMRHPHVEWPHSQRACQA